MSGCQNALIDRFAHLGVLEEITGQQRNRRYRNTPFLDLFAEWDPLEAGSNPLETATSR
jgi:hypothetical protein